MTITWIRVAYGVVLGLVLFLTAQTGVAMAFKGPKAPDDPGITFRQLTGGDNDQSQNRLTASIDKFYADAKDYRDKYVDYQRNVFLAAAGIAALLAVIGLVLPAAVNYLRFGLLVGAAATFLWAMWFFAQTPPQPAPQAQGLLELLSAGTPKQLDFAGRFLRFALSFVGLIFLLFIGLWRLTEWPASTRRATVATTTTTPAPAPAMATTAAGAPSPAAASWAPPPAGTTPASSATESTSVITDSTAARAEQPPGEPVPWQRPAEDGEPARAPDAPV